MEEPEPALIRAAAAGDLDAFEALVRSHQLPVWRFLRQFLNDAELAEDVAQETFVRLYRHLPTFAFQSKFSTWTFQIARNAAVDAVRARDRREKYERQSAPPPPPSEPARSAEVQLAINELSDKLREALLLVELFGVSYREAAGMLGIAEGTVKSRVFQARTEVARAISGTQSGAHSGRQRKAKEGGSTS